MPALSGGGSEVYRCFSEQHLPRSRKNLLTLRESNHEVHLRPDRRLFALFISCCGRAHPRADRMD